MINIFPNFLSSNECDELVAHIESIGFVTQHSGFGIPIRSKCEFQNQNLVDKIWQRIKSQIPEIIKIYSKNLKPYPEAIQSLQSYVPIGINDLFRCYKYLQDEEFRPHQDFAHEYDQFTRTFLTGIIYLNDNFVGGETKILDKIYIPQKGQYTIFPHELEHAGMKINKGVKYALRADIIFQSKK